MKGRTPLRIYGGPQAATVCFNDGTADRQAHTGPLWLRRIESTEQPVRLFAGKANAGISNGDQQEPLFSALRPDSNLAGSVRYGLKAIQQQVHQYLLQLDAICHDLRQLASKLRAQRDGVPVGLVTQQRKHFPGDLIYIDQLEFRRSTCLVERTQTMDDFGSAASVMLNSFSRRAGSFQIGRIVRKPAQAGIGACDCSSNGLIEFMGKRTG